MYYNFDGTVMSLPPHPHLENFQRGDIIKVTNRFKKVERFKNGEMMTSMEFDDRHSFMYCYYFGKSMSNAGTSLYHIIQMYHEEVDGKLCFNIGPNEEGFVGNINVEWFSFEKIGVASDFKITGNLEAITYPYYLD